MLRKALIRKKRVSAHAKKDCMSERNPLFIKYSISSHHSRHYLSAFNLLLQNFLQGNSICREFRDTLPQLLDCHCFFVKIEAEQRFVVEVRAFRDVEAAGVRGD